MTKRYNSVAEAEEALRDARLFKQKVPTLYMHPIFRDDLSLAIRVEFWQGMTPDEITTAVERALKILNDLKKELSERH
jgi:hypothetical protein